MPRNSIFVIQPFRFAGMWVFTEPNLGLMNEPFVCGTENIIDEALRLKKFKRKAFTMLFSENAFPGHDYVLKWESSEDSGNWYVWEKTNMRGWLCPALFKFFHDTPMFIYVQLKQKLYCEE